MQPLGQFVLAWWLHTQPVACATTRPHLVAAYATSLIWKDIAPAMSPDFTPNKLQVVELKIVN